MNTVNVYTKVQPFKKKSYLSYAFKNKTMNIFNQVIGLMSKEEVRHLKLYLSRTNNHNERKDVQLFDIVRKKFPEYDEEKICLQLYNHDDKNVLYRLKNRLLEDIGKSMSVHYFDNNAFAESQNYLALSRIYQQKRQFDIAFYYLKKPKKNRSNYTMPNLPIQYMGNT